MKNNLSEIQSNLLRKGIIPEMILTDWILTLGFKNVPLIESINLAKGLLAHGWNFLFYVIGEVYKTLFPTFKRYDMAITLGRLKNSARSGIFAFGKTSIPWHEILVGGKRSLDWKK